ncbi:uncharacterized protein LOC132300944 [Cornus florida]|uniref:uncharacterized protein LOC132300944 n=1 Tax=Cornus florida TaxID=4283 RepID=UPI0028992841|nr:uncharacterized protein LOC132300944 [Cornus florida]
MKFMKLGTRPDTFYTEEATRTVISEIPSDLTIRINNINYLLHKGDTYTDDSHDSRLLCLGENTTTTKEYRYPPPNIIKSCHLDSSFYECTPADFIKKQEMNLLHGRCLYDSMKKQNMNMLPDPPVYNASNHRHTKVGAPRFIGTCHGWLLFYLFFKESLYFFNPLSRMVVELPPPPFWKPPLFLWNMSPCPWDINLITSSILTDPTCKVFLYTSCEIAVYRLSDGKWTQAFKTNFLIASMIFYKGNFYSVDGNGVLRRCLFDDNYFNYTEEVVLDSYSNYTEEVVIFDRIKVRCNSNCDFKYLVESWSGELLMVVKTLDHYRDLDSNQPRMRTKSFEIFKVNWSNCEWEKVSNFGDHTLFLAKNNSMFVRVGQNSEYKHNSIYFIDDVKGLIDPWYEDFGVYNLKNGKIESLNLSKRQMRRKFCLDLGFLSPELLLTEVYV